MKQILSIISLAIANLICVAQSTFSPSSASGNWNNATNWTPNGIPTSSTDVIIPTGKTCVIPNSYVAVAKSITINGGTLSASYNSTLTISTSFTINSGTFTINTVKNVSASSLIANGGTINLGSTIYSFAVPFPTISGAVNLNLGTVAYNANTSQTIASYNYYNLATGGSGIKNLISDINVSNNLTINNTSELSATTFNLKIVGNLTGSGSLSFTSGNLNISGNNTHSGTFTSGIGTVTYDRDNGNQTVAGKNYYNLLFSNLATRTLSGTIGIGNVFNPNGTVIVGTSTVNFNGGLQTIPAFTFNNLTIGGSNDKTLSGDVVVNSNLTFSTSSDLNTSSFSIRLPASGTITGASNSAHIIGNLRRNFSSTYPSQSFPVGNGSALFGLSVTGSNITGQGYLQVSSLSVAEPISSNYSLISSSGYYDFTKLVNRYWKITNSSLAFSNLDVTVNYLNPTDLGSGNPSPSRLTGKYYRYATSAWTSVSGTNRTSNSINLPNIPHPTTGNSIDLWLGEVQSSKCISQSSGSWESPSTWTNCPNGIPTVSDSVIISSGHIITMDGNIGNVFHLLINGTAKWTSNYTTEVGNGGVDISSTGDISGSALGTLLIGGNLKIDNPTISSTSVSLDFKYGISQSISTSLPNTSFTIPRIGIYSNVTNSIPKLTISNALTGSSSFTLTQPSSSSLYLNLSSNGISSPTINASASNSNVTFSRAGNQSISPGNYYNLRIVNFSLNPKTTTLGGMVTIINNFEFDFGSGGKHILLINDQNKTLNGLNTANFTIKPRAVLALGATSNSNPISFPSNFATYDFQLGSTVAYYSNSSSQIINTTPSYSNLTIATGLTSLTKKLSGSMLTVSKDLTITSGIGNLTLDLEGNTLNIGGEILGSGSLLLGNGSNVNYNGSTGTQNVLAANYHHLSLTNNSNKILPNTTIKITGNFLNSSNMDAITNNSTIELNGTNGVQTITGTNTFYNLTKSGASTLGTLNEIQNVTNLFRISSGSGQINSNGKITILEDASLLDDNSISSFPTGTIGYVVVKKSASDINRSYFLSSPIATYTSTNLQAGQTAQVLGYDTDGTPLDNTTIYKNTCSPSLRQKGSVNGLYKNKSGQLTVGKGYSVKQSTSKSLEFIGNVNNGDINFPVLTTINRTIPDGSGYAWCASTNGLVLLGNPYPSAIDWGMVYASSSGINTSAKIWNGVNYTDVSSNDATLANRVIKSGQGFFIQVATSSIPGGSLVFQNSQRLGTNNGTLLRTMYNENIKIQLANTTKKDFSDVLKINFNESATDNFDPEFDSYDLVGLDSVPSIVAIVDGNNLSTTEMPVPLLNKSIPVELSISESNNYEIQALKESKIPDNMEVYLLDKLTNREYNLTEPNIIKLEKGDYTKFEIQLRKADMTSSSVTYNSDLNKVYTSGSNIVLEYNKNSPSDVTILDVTGRILLSKNNLSAGRYEFDILNKNTTQFYIVKISNQSETNTYKIISK